MRKRWNKTEIDFLKRSYGSLTAISIAKELGRTKKSIECKAAKIDLKGIRETNRDLVNGNYFNEIDCVKKAYLLGLLLADGNVSQSSGGHYIRLVLKDRILVEFARNELAPHRPIYPHLHGSVGFQVGNKELFDSLAHYGMVPNKSQYVFWPNDIPERFEAPFLLGYFDGDGCLHYSGIYPIWTLYGTQQFLTVAAQKIKYHINVIVTGPKPKSDKKWLWRMWATSDRARAIDSWLHHQCNLGLNRKRIRK